MITLFSNFLNNYRFTNACNKTDTKLNTLVINLFSQGKYLYRYIQIMFYTVIKIFVDKHLSIKFLQFAMQRNKQHNIFTNSNCTIIDADLF